MKIEVTCNVCNKKELVIKSRSIKYKTCSTKCMGIFNTAKPNKTCAICQKPIKVKNNAIRERNFCSKKCFYIDKKTSTKGENNHQYGLTGNLNSSFKGDNIKRKNNSLIDIRSYVPDHPYCDSNGRVTIHRLIVEDYHFLFNKDYFNTIGNNFYLKKSVDVHHKDDNHNNNDISNLEPLTRSEHVKLHNSYKYIIRDKKGKIMTTIKSLKKLETLILEWAKEKNLLNEDCIKKQSLKLIEECGETAKAIIQSNNNEIIDGVGDIFVVLVILAAQKNQKLELTSANVVDENEFSLDEFGLFSKIVFSENVNNSIFNLNLLSVKNNLDLVVCANHAWEEIKDRKGKTVNGSFIREK